MESGNVTPEANIWYYEISLTYFYITGIGKHLMFSYKLSKPNSVKIKQNKKPQQVLVTYFKMRDQKKNQWYQFCQGALDTLFFQCI